MKIKILNEKILSTQQSKWKEEKKERSLRSYFSWEIIYLLSNLLHVTCIFITKTTTTYYKVSFNFGIEIGMTYT